MDFGETLIVLFGVVFVFGSPVAIYALSLFSKQRQSFPSSAIRELIDEVRAQNRRVQQMEERLANLEHVVSGSEFQAAQRVASALESASAEFSRPTEPARRG